MNSIDFKTISIPELAALINQKFIEHNMKTVLVGGACVTIYSHNRYLSYDLDFVTFETRGKIKEALLETVHKPKNLVCCLIRILSQVAHEYRTKIPIRPL